MIRLKQALFAFAALACLGAALLIMVATGLPEANTGNGASGFRALAAIGSPAPRFGLRNASNELVSLEPNAGTVTIISFWSTACAPCRRELRELQRVHQDHPEVTRILAINLGESRDSVIAWRDQLGLSLELLLDPALHAARLYKVRGLPTTYILDERLIIRGLRFGPISYSHLLGEARQLAQLG